MNFWNIVLTPEAAEDIKNIYDYISGNLKNHSAVKKQVEKIIDCLHSLEMMPLRYSLYEKEPWKSRGLRKVGVGNFMIFYLAENITNNIVVLRVLYSGRDIDSVFKA